MIYKFYIQKTSDFVNQKAIPIEFTKDTWAILSPIEQSIKAKIEKYGTPLKDWDIRIYRGILTGCNEAFIISGEKRKELIAEDPKSDEIIRPILRGRDIKRYGYNFADLYVILAKFGSYKYLNKLYPAIYNHLKKFEDKLKQRGQCRYRANGKPATNPDSEFPGQHHWLELDNNPRQDYLDDFSKQKLCWTPVNSEYKFALVDPNIYINNGVFMIIGNNLDNLCFVLNSKLFRFYFNIILSTEYQYGSKEIFQTVPINYNLIKQENISNIDIYDTYNLTEEEIKFIENSINNYL